jgi:hypothetical protein
MSNANYLSKRGYVLIKKNFSKTEIESLKQQLTAKPLTDDKFNNNHIVNYPVYIETKTKLYIPKMFGIKKFGLPVLFLDNYIGKSWVQSIPFHGEIYPHQVEPVDVLIKSCYENGGGILQAETGIGKSVIALKVLSQLQSKTIIMVNKIALLHQWKNEINTFLPLARVGIIQGKKIADVENCDIVVIMLQSLSLINYPETLFKDFQCVVVDEIHRSSSKEYSKTLFKLACKYTIGLSATPKKADGTEYVFKWHIGEICYKSFKKREGLPPIIRFLKIDTNEYKEICSTNFTGQKQIQFTSMLSDLIQMSKRNSLVVEILKQLINCENRKQILVISERREHLQNIKTLLDADLSIKFTYGLYLGGATTKKAQERNEISRKSQVILATASAFGEGVSEKNLDTLLLITPKKYVDEKRFNTINNKKDGGGLKQLVGRIFRKDHILLHPLIIDFYDNFSVYKSQFNSRKIFYKEHFTNAIFEEQSIKLDEHQDVKYQYIQIKPKK